MSGLITKRDLRFEGFVTKTNVLFLMFMAISALGVVVAYLEFLLWTESMALVVLFLVLMWLEEGTMEVVLYGERVV